MTHIMRINEEEFVEKLNITPMSKDRLGSGNVPSQYHIMLWCYAIEFSKNPIFKDVDKESIEMLEGDGYVCTLTEYIDTLKQFSKKTGLPISIETPDEGVSCVVNVGNCCIGTFIITSIKDNPKILRMAVGDEDKDFIQIK